jgi:hypothetical protein
MNLRFPIRSAFSFLVLLLTIGSGTTLAACTTSSGGTGPEILDASVDATEPESAPDDTSFDTTAEEAAPPEAGEPDASDASDAPVDAPCDGLRCHGACLAATNCLTCVGAPLLCGNECVNNCSTCVDTQNQALPIECYSCDSAHQNPIGTCAATDDSRYCLNGNYAGSYVDGGPGFHCACGDGGASDCPGRTQVCAPTPAGPTFCVTCGEIYVFDLSDAGCQNGKSCNPSAATCQ